MSADGGCFSSWLYETATLLAFTVLAGEPATLWADAPRATKTPYATAHDAPLDVTLKVVEDTPSLTRYRVEFNGIARDRVPGFLYVPKNIKGKRPAILMQPGIGDNKKTS